MDAHVPAAQGNGDPRLRPHREGWRRSFILLPRKAKRGIGGESDAIRRHSDRFQKLLGSGIADRYGCRGVTSNSRELPGVLGK